MRGRRVRSSSAKPASAWRRRVYPLGSPAKAVFVPMPNCRLVSAVTNLLRLSMTKRESSSSKTFSRWKPILPTQRRRIPARSAFLEKVGFPAHGLIAVPNDRIKVGHDDRIRLVLEDVPNQQVFKGIHTPAELDRVVQQCAALSADGLAHVETDMRAHFNPTRMRAIGVLAEQLGRRLARTCPDCGAPGWGRIHARWETPTNDVPFVADETLGCAHCGHRQAAAPPSDSDQRQAIGD